MSQDEAPNEARNLAFMSSLVMTGEGWGVVIRTGDDTMIGSIASLATGEGEWSEALAKVE